MMKLSGGLKRRFMVAKALIHRPRLLILDEPTAGVDVELRRTLWDFVREINRDGTTVLLTTHYLEEAEAMCERLAIMNHGRLVALERTSELLARLDGRTVVLYLQRPLDAMPAELTRLGAEWRPERSVLSIPLPAEMTVIELLAKLHRLDLPIADLEVRRAGLEEIFIELTGMERGGHEVKA
jgi:ABC-2 type transport system ATP-binding protein